MTNDQTLTFIAWSGGALWLTVGALLIARYYRVAAVINAALILPFLVPSVWTLLRWGLDPAGYVRQYGAAAKADVRSGAAMAGLALLALLGSVMAYRGSLRSSVIVWLLNGAGLTLLFYLVYFFRIW